MKRGGLPLRMRDNGGLDWGGVGGTREGEADDDFAQSANLLSPPGHAASAANGWLQKMRRPPSLPPSLLSLDGCGPECEASAGKQTGRGETKAGNVNIDLGPLRILAYLPAFRFSCVFYAEVGMKICK